MSTPTSGYEPMGAQGNSARAVKVPLLDNSNFPVWKKEVTVYLQHCGYWTCVFDSSVLLSKKNDPLSFVTPTIPNEEAD